MAVLDPDSLPNVLMPAPSHKKDASGRFARTPRFASDPDVPEPVGCDSRTTTANLRRLPCTAVYDFCNAFPTLLHQWLFLLLRVLEVPERYRWVITWMYSMVTTFSSGVADGSI